MREASDLAEAPIADLVDPQRVARRAEDVAAFACAGRIPGDARNRIRHVNAREQAEPRRRGRRRRRCRGRRKQGQRVGRVRVKREGAERDGRVGRRDGERVEGRRRGRVRSHSGEGHGRRRA